MFQLKDLPKFFLAFFLVMPVISILHEMGHVFFAWLMGGKKIRVTVGTGKPILHLGIFDIRQYYFWYGVCTFENIERKQKYSNVLIFSGGALFNFIGTFVVMYLIEEKIIDPGMLTYQFTYFSLYYIFFALLPMPYPDGNYSDGKIILDLLRGKEEVVQQRTYRIQWDSKQDHWEVFDHNNRSVHNCKEQDEALERARDLAQKNRPSKIIHSKNGKEKEVQNYPRTPL